VALKPSPFLTAGVLAVVVGFLLDLTGTIPSPSVQDRISVFGTVAQVCGTLGGFLLAALAIVASISNTALLKAMRESGHYDSLLKHMFTGTLLFLTATVVCILVVLGVTLPAWVQAVLFGILVSGLVVLIITGWQFWLTLVNVSGSSQVVPKTPDVSSIE
jgi:phosphatidylglycerophosphate synthase